METLSLIVEKSQGRFWGRVKYENTWLTDIDKSVDGLESRFKAQLHRYFNLKSDTIRFSRHYDLTSLFVQFHFLKLPVIANRSGIQPEILRQYAEGLSYPSLEETQKVERALREIGGELSNAFVIARVEPL